MCFSGLHQISHVFPFLFFSVFHLASTFFEAVVVSENADPRQAQGEVTKSWHERSRRLGI
jgi:hypothetical protein